MKREDIEKIYDLGKDAVVDFIMELLVRIEALEEKIAKLEGQRNKDSRKSSKPPSSDGFKKKNKTRNQRKRSGKRTGGQNGHPGNTLEMVANPVYVKRIKVKSCGCCGKSIKDAHPKGYDARQRF
jgi:transposase